MQIALFGKMRSGKDAIAEYAIQEYDFYRFAFGDGIRKLCNEYFPELVSNGKKPRQLYQGVGQDLRKYSPDIWVNKCFSEIENKRVDYAMVTGEDGLKPIITDLRQPNEYKRCKEKGFTFIKVHADDKIRLQRMNEKGDSFALEDLNHETESHIDTFEYDYIITNNGSFEYAIHQFNQIYEELRKY